MNLQALNIKYSKTYKDIVSVFLGESADRFETCMLYKEKNNIWSINFAFKSSMDIKTAKELNYVNTVGVLLADKLNKNIDKDIKEVIDGFMKGQK